MKRATLTARGALRAMIAAGALATSVLVPVGAGAEDDIGIILSTSPSGTPTKSIVMRIPAEATDGSVPLFIYQQLDRTLFGVEFSATPLVDQNGVGSVTPTFEPAARTLPEGGGLRRVELKVAGLTPLGTFTSTLYATLANRTQTLGTLTVTHTRNSSDLQIASIGRARGQQTLPGATTDLTFLVTVRNNGDRRTSLAAPVITRLDNGGKTSSKSHLPHVRVTEQDGRPPGGSYPLGPGEQTTLTVVVEDLEDTGSYTGTFRVAAAGHDPVEQRFAFDVKLGPVLPVLLIALGVGLSYVLRRRYSSGRIGRNAQRRVVERLLEDLGPLRRRRDLEEREAHIVATLERRLASVSDELELAGVGSSAEVLSEIDNKIDLIDDFLAARRHVRAMTPAELQEPFEAQLADAAVFLREATPARDLESRYLAVAKTLTEMPAAVEGAVRERFLADVDRFLANVEASSTVAETLPLRVLKRIENGRQLAEAGRFTEARAELGGAQLAFARFLAEDFAARLPDSAGGPPGFVEGWPRFRAAILDALRTVQRDRRGGHAAEAYRRLWQEYAVEVATRLRSAASRERRKATDARREQLVKIMETCDDVIAKALEFDPATVDGYRRAVEMYLGRRRSSALLRQMLDDAQLPPPVTIVAAGLGDNGRVPRPEPRPLDTAASLTHQIRTRQFSVALVAAIAAVPGGLLLLWAPSATWGTFADGAAAFFGGFGLHALGAGFDARRLGWKLTRAAAPSRRSTERQRLAATST